MALTFRVVSSIGIFRHLACWQFDLNIYRTFACILMGLGLTGVSGYGQGSAAVSNSSIKNAESVTSTAFQWNVQVLGTDVSFRALAVPSDDVIWVSGSNCSIFKSVDAGENWSAISVAGYDQVDFRSIHAFDERQACIASAGSPAVILKTSDGGMTWELKYKNPSPQAFFDSLYFQDDLHGLAVSDPVDGAFLVVETRDGGETWQEVPRGESPLAMENEAAFAASNSCIATCNGNLFLATGGGPENSIPVEHSKATLILRAKDEAGWNRIDAKLQRGASAGVFAIHFRDSNHGVIVGGDYKKESDGTRSAAWSSDGGRTWQLSDSQPSGFRSAVVWRHSSEFPEYYTVGPNGTDCSSDGRVWRVASSEGFHTIRVSPSGRLWAAGSAGRIAWFE